MKKAYPKFIMLSLLVLMGTIPLTLAMAQEDIYRIDYTEIFGKLRRPAIDFAHEDHVDALEDQGCGACHHAPDDKTGQLIYIPDEEVSCSECHGPTREDDTPALRQAFHGSCNACHRQLGKRRKILKDRPLAVSAIYPDKCR